MSGEGFLVWHTAWFWSLVCVGLASARITFESLTCEELLCLECPKCARVGHLTWACADMCVIIKFWDDPEYKIFHQLVLRNVSTTVHVSLRQTPNTNTACNVHLCPQPSNPPSTTSPSTVPGCSEMYRTIPHIALPAL